MSDRSWEYLTDPDVELLGLKDDTTNMKGWLNDINQRVNAIENDEEAIRKLFVINQKIGYVKGRSSSYSSYPPKLYEKLQSMVNILLGSRLRQITNNK